MLGHVRQPGGEGQREAGEMVCLQERVQDRAARGRGTLRVCGVRKKEVGDLNLEEIEAFKD